jgi:hypothetical protein
MNWKKEGAFITLASVPHVPELLATSGRNLIEKLVVTQILGTPPLYGTRIFIAVFTVAHNWPVSRSKRSNFIPLQFVCLFVWNLFIIIIISSLSRFPKWSLYLRPFNQNCLHVSHICHAVSLTSRLHTCIFTETELLAVKDLVHWGIRFLSSKQKSHLTSLYGA